MVFEGYEIDLTAEYSGSGSGHEVQAAFSGAGARASMKASSGNNQRRRKVQGLNVAVIHPEAPQTALNISLQGKGTTSAFAGKLSISNPEPGPIDRERVPVARLEAAFPTDMKTIVFDSLRTQMHPAGSLVGKGRASLEGATLEIRISNLDLRSIYSSLRATLSPEAGSRRCGRAAAVKVRSRRRT